MVTITEKLKKDGIDIYSEYPNVVKEKVRNGEKITVVIKNSKRKKTMELR